jgi:hypothetical protein
MRWLPKVPNHATGKSGVKRVPPGLQVIRVEEALAEAAGCTIVAGGDDNTVILGEQAGGY